MLGFTTFVRPLGVLKHWSCDAAASAWSQSVITIRSLVKDIRSTTPGPPGEAPRGLEAVSLSLIFKSLQIFSHCYCYLGHIFILRCSGGCVACKIVVSASVPVPFLWTLDLGFGICIWDLDLGLGFGTGLGLDNKCKDLLYQLKWNWMNFKHFSRLSHLMHLYSCQFVVRKPKPTPG